MRLAAPVATFPACRWTSRVGSIRSPNPGIPREMIGLDRVGQGLPGKVVMLIGPARRIRNLVGIRCGTSLHELQDGSDLHDPSSAPSVSSLAPALATLSHACLLPGLQKTRGPSLSSIAFGPAWLEEEEFWADANTD